ncbi:hypothetical protein F4861DRAFT_541806 [Xylaria intraflava]|nr:hypothetical protein F4861DRAFT_541806 [Xylaria intraflava]
MSDLTFNEMERTFHPYPRLPTELKLKIWAMAYEEWETGAHHFKLMPAPVGKPGLQMKTFRSKKDDDSAWRERYALSKVDKYAFDTFIRFDKERTTFRLGSNSRRRVNQEEVKEVAKVDGIRDLVTFRISMENYSLSALSFDIDNIDNIDGWEKFQGITHIGLENRILDGQRPMGAPLSTRVFSCICPTVGATQPLPPRVCARNFITFLRLFPDLKSFNIIVPLSLGATKIGLLLPIQGESQFVKHGGGITQSCLRTLEYFLETAKKRDLKLFYDRRGVYCEVSHDDVNHLQYGNKFVDLLWQMRSAIRHWNSLHPTDKLDVRLGILVRADLRNVYSCGSGPNETGGIRLRAPQPWA